MHTHSASCNCLSPTPTEIDPTQQARKMQRLWIALVTVGSFSIAEWMVGWLSHSLALVAESVHMVSDCLSLGLALWASWLAQRPRSDQATFGYRRAEILAALVNGLGLVAIAIWIGIEAVTRLQQVPDELLTTPMLIIATIGLAINSLNAALLHDHSHTDLNVRGAFLHMVADAASAVGVMLVAVCIWAFGWNWADGIVSLGVAGLILVGAIPLVQKSLRILLEQTPQQLNVSQVTTDLLACSGVVAVESLRVWTIAFGYDALTAHLRVNLPDGADRDRLVQHLQELLRSRYALSETVIQLTSVEATPPLTLSLPSTLEQLNTTTTPSLRLASYTDS